MSTWSPGAKEIDSLDLPDLGRVTKGLRVEHPSFGKGTVTALLQFRRGRQAIGVEFDGHGYKVLDPEYAKLRLQ